MSGVWIRAVEQVGGDARGPEAVAADALAKFRFGGTALDHREDIEMIHLLRRQVSVPVQRAEERMDQ